MKKNIIAAAAIAFVASLIGACVVLLCGIGGATSTDENPQGLQFYPQDDGTYIVSGSTNDIMLVISAGSNDKVQLVFDGVSINNSEKPAVYVKSADKVFITLNSFESSLNEKAGNPRTAI